MLRRWGNFVVSLWVGLLQSSLVLHKVFFSWRGWVLLGSFSSVFTKVFQATLHSRLELFPFFRLGFCPLNTGLTKLNTR